MYNYDPYQNEISEVVQNALDEGYSLNQIVLMLTQVITYFVQQEIED